MENNNNNNNNKKKLTWAVGLIAGLGILSIAYAALSSTLNIKGNTTVDIGTVRFIAEGEENYTDKGCKVFGIGSTNPEYVNGTFMSDTIAPPGGASSSRGLITSNFDTNNIAKALVSQPGTLTLNDATGNEKEKDTVTIKDVKLNDYGSFVVYRLDIVNTSSNDMALASAPNISVTKKEGSVEGDKIEAGLYQSCDSANFATPCGGDTNKVQSAPKSVGGGGGSAVINKQDASSYNYLKPSETTTWYLRIGFKNYSAENNTLGTTSFDFSVSPRWEAVM